MTTMKEQKKADVQMRILSCDRWVLRRAPRLRDADRAGVYPALLARGWKAKNMYLPKLL